MIKQIERAITDLGIVCDPIDHVSISDVVRIIEYLRNAPTISLNNLKVGDIVQDRRRTLYKVIHIQDDTHDYPIICEAINDDRTIVGYTREGRRYQYGGTHITDLQSL